MTNRCIKKLVEFYCVPSGIPRNLAKLDGSKSVFAHNTDIAGVAYKAPTTPWRWQPLAETCRGKIWNTLIKFTSSLTHLLVILQRHYKILGPAIKIITGIYVTTNIYVWSHLITFFLAREMFHTEVVEKIKHTFYDQLGIRISCRLWGNVKKYCRPGQITGNKYGSCSLNAGYLRLQTHSQNM
jgi:hypothetical protein